MLTWKQLGHPYEPTLAVSGIDQTIKIFSPDSRAQHDASNGINIADPDAQSNLVVGVESVLGEGQTSARGIGLESRKRLHDSYQILSQNDVNRQGGMNEAFLTVRLLQPLTILRRGLSFAEWAALF